jgi:archaemetzincin
MMVYIQPLVSASRQPLGDCPVRQKVVTETEQAILSTFDVEVISLPSQPLPDVAYYRPRNRYRADKLLEFLANTASLDGARVIGITEVDISTTKGEYYDWGIFGLSRMPGSVCVVSTWRLRSRTSEEWFYERLKKVVLHELGHTFGLDHCPTRGCLMEDAKGRVSTVDAETDFCEDCRAELHGLLK